MSSVFPVSAIMQVPLSSAAQSLHAAQVDSPVGFGDLIAQGIAAVDEKVAKADNLITAFATGAPVPVHEVTIALEQARLAVELAGQVRTHLIETYREFMNMQV